ncbi:MAG: hypothetical protein AAGC60_25615 [Acidobacteriota bacterium]
MTPCRFHRMPSSFVRSLRVELGPWPALALLFAALAMMLAQAAGAELSVASTKILNGPPHELSQMRLQDPAAAATSSRGVERDVVLDASSRLAIPADPGSSFRLVVIGPHEKLEAVELETPSGRRVRASELSTKATPEAEESLELVRSSHDAGSAMLTLEAVGGRIPHRLSAPSLTPVRAKAADESIYLRVENRSSYVLRASFDRWLRRVGEPLRLEAVLAIEADEGRADDPIVRIEHAKVRLERADGWTHEVGPAELELVQDGFGIDWTPPEAGTYAVSIETSGRTASGAPIERTLRTTVRIASAALDLAGDGAEKRSAGVQLVVDDRFHRVAAGTSARGGKALGAITADGGEITRLRFDVPLQVTAELPARVVAHAELWGRDAEGRPEAVAWVGGIKEPVIAGDGTVRLPLGIDARWFQRSAARPPFELRTLRLHDVDTFEVLALASRLPVEIAVAPSLVAGRSVDESKDALDRLPAIDRTMRYGPAPAKTTSIDRDAGASELATKNGLPVERLVISHGYCGSNAGWMPYISDFWATLDAHGRNKVHLFNDPRQGRSHDQFAQQLMAFIEARPDDAYSIIGQSQGGVAGVHLLAFYNFEPLDSSAATYKVQTVASPWGGSQIMDTLEYLTSTNSLLGPVGRIVTAMWECPIVPNLTTGGAALWRSLLPPAVLDAVRFYRAKGGTWPCHEVLSALIHGDDDGVVTVTAQGHTGVDNGGLKTQQCHGGFNFRHPPVHADWLRNESMARLGRTWYVKTCFELNQSSGFAPATVDFDTSCLILRHDVPVENYYWRIVPTTTDAEGAPIGGEYYALGPDPQITVTEPGEYLVELSIVAFVDGEWRVDRDTRPLRVAGGGISLCAPGELCPWLCDNPLEC